jgi:hypothetical protein
MDRRMFCKIVFHGTLIPVVAKFVPYVPVKLSKTITGKKTITPILWPEGWHTVRIKDVEVVPSKTHEGSNLLRIQMENLDGDAVLYKHYSDRAPIFLMRMLEKAKIDLNQAKEIDLDEMVGREIQVEITHFNYAGRMINEVRV